MAQQKKKHFTRRLSEWGYFRVNRIRRDGGGETERDAMESNHFEASAQCAYSIALENRVQCAASYPVTEPSIPYCTQSRIALVTCEDHDHDTFISQLNRKLTNQNECEIHNVYDVISATYAMPYAFCIPNWICVFFNVKCSTE